MIYINQYVAVQQQFDVLLPHESFMLIIWVSIAQLIVPNGDINNLPKYHRWITVDNGGKSNEFDSHVLNCC